jgi:uncharacterized membrane protein (UPF0127 family)
MRQICAVHAAGKPEVRLYVADSFWERLRGLLGTRQLPARTGLLLKHCNSIHMFFMHYGIDVVYVDKHFRIVKLVQNLRPWQISGCLKAVHTIEVPVGTIAAMGWKLQEPLFL